MADDKYKGKERRSQTRRAEGERRDLVRWEPKKDDRRKSQGRRKNDGPRKPI